MSSTLAQDGYCNGIQPGDIMVTGFNMDDPDEVVMVLLEVLPGDATFYVTDRSWDGAQFVDSENDGTLRWSFDQDLPQSLEICHRCTQDGSVLDRFIPVGNSTFSLDSNGDTIMLYCMMEGENGMDTIQHINAITNLGGWNVNVSSLLPDSLSQDFVTTLQYFPNYEYDGQSVGTASQIRAGLSDASYWDGHEDYIDNLQTLSSFKIVEEPGSGVSVTLSLSSGAWGITLVVSVLTMLLLAGSSGTSKIS